MSKYLFSVWLLLAVCCDGALSTDVLRQAYVGSTVAPDGNRTRSCTLAPIINSGLEFNASVFDTLVVVATPAEATNSTPAICEDCVYSWEVCHLLYNDTCFDTELPSPFTDVQGANLPILFLPLVLVNSTCRNNSNLTDATVSLSCVMSPNGQFDVMALAGETFRFTVVISYGSGCRNFSHVDVHFESVQIEDDFSSSEEKSCSFDVVVDGAPAFNASIFDALVVGALTLDQGQPFDCMECDFAWNICHLLDSDCFKTDLPAPFKGVEQLNYPILHLPLVVVNMTCRNNTNLTAGDIGCAMGPNGQFDAIALAGETYRFMVSVSRGYNCSSSTFVDVTFEDSSIPSSESSSQSGESSSSSSESSSSSSEAGPCDIIVDLDGDIFRRASIFDALVIDVRRSLLVDPENASNASCDGCAFEWNVCHLLRSADDDVCLPEVPAPFIHVREAHLPILYLPLVAVNATCRNNTNITVPENASCAMGPNGQFDVMALAGETYRFSVEISFDDRCRRAGHVDILFEDVNVPPDSAESSSSSSSSSSEESSSSSEELSCTLSPKINGEPNVTASIHQNLTLEAILVDASHNNSVQNCSNCTFSWNVCHILGQACLFEDVPGPFLVLANFHLRDITIPIPKIADFLCWNGTDATAVTFAASSSSQVNITCPHGPAGYFDLLALVEEKFRFFVDVSYGNMCIKSSSIDVIFAVPTETPTSTPTSTDTFTKTSSDTSSRTFTNTLMETPTVTITGSETPTPTETDSSTRIPTLAPTLPVLIVTLEGPTTVGPCSGLTISASATMKGTLFYWSLEGIGPTVVSSVLRETFLNATTINNDSTVAQVILSASQFPAGVYNITVAVHNFIMDDVDTLIVTKTLESTHLRASILGSQSLSVIRAQSLRLTGAANLTTNCPSAPVHFDWTLVSPFDATLNLTRQASITSTNTSSTLSFGKYELEAGMTYMFAVRASATTVEPYFAWAFINVTVVPQPMTLRIQNGNFSIGPATSFNLTTVATDPDEDLEALPPYRYQWTACTLLSDGSCVSLLSIGPWTTTNLTQSYLHVVGSTTNPFSSSTTIRISVELQRLLFSNHSMVEASLSDFVDLTVESSDPPIVEILVKWPLLEDNEESTKYNYDADFLASSLVIDPLTGLALTNNISYLWSLTSPTLPQRLLKNASNWLIGNTNSDFGVMASLLTADFYVRLDVVWQRRDAQGQPFNVTGFAQVLIPVNQPPMTGSLQIADSSGNTAVSANTEITLSALNWSDEDLPLSYQFSYTYLGEEKFLYAKDPTASFVVTKTPLLSNDSMIIYSVYVYDAFGAVAMASLNVTVKGIAITSSILKAQSSAIDNALKSGDVGAALDLIDSQLLGLMSVPDDSADLSNALNQAAAAVAAMLNATGPLSSTQQQRVLEMLSLMSSSSTANGPSSQQILNYAISALQEGAPLSNERALFIVNNIVTKVLDSALKSLQALKTASRRRQVAFSPQDVSNATAQGAAVASLLRELINRVGTGVMQNMLTGTSQCIVGGAQEPFCLLPAAGSNCKPNECNCATATQCNATANCTWSSTFVTCMRNTTLCGGPQMLICLAAMSTSTSANISLTIGETGDLPANQATAVIPTGWFSYLRRLNLTTVHVQTNFYRQDKSPYAFSDSGTAPVLSMVLKPPGKYQDVSISNMSSNMSWTIPTRDVNTTKYSYGCYFWDGPNYVWNSSGVFLNSTSANSLTCLTNHLTEFTSYGTLLTYIDRSSSPLPAIPGPDYRKSFMWVVGVCWLIWICFTILAVVLDLVRRHYPPRVVPVSAPSDAAVVATDEENLTTLWSAFKSRHHWIAFFFRHPLLLSLHRVALVSCTMFGCLFFNAIWLAAVSPPLKWYGACFISPWPMLLIFSPILGFGFWHRRKRHRSAPKYAQSAENAKQTEPVTIPDQIQAARIGKTTLSKTCVWQPSPSTSAGPKKLSTTGLPAPGMTSPTPAPPPVKLLGRSSSQGSVGDRKYTFKFSEVVECAMEEFSLGRYVCGVHLLMEAAVCRSETWDEKTLAVRLTSIKDAKAVAQAKLKLTPDELEKRFQADEDGLAEWVHAVDAVRNHQFRTAFSGFRAAFLVRNPDLHDFVEADLSIRPWVEYYAEKWLNLNRHHFEILLSALPNGAGVMSPGGGGGDAGSEAGGFLDEMPLVRARASDLKEAAVEELRLNRVLTGIHLLMEASTNGLRESAEDEEELNFIDVPSAKRRVQEILEVTAERLEQIIVSDIEQCPEWGSALELMKDKLFARAHVAFYEALVVMSPDLQDIIGRRSVRPWVNYYAEKLHGLTPQQVAAAVNKGAAKVLSSHSYPGSGSSSSGGGSGRRPGSTDGGSISEEGMTWKAGIEQCRVGQYYKAARIFVKAGAQLPAAAAVAESQQPQQAGSLAFGKQWALFYATTVPPGSKHTRITIDQFESDFKKQEEQFLSMHSFRPTDVDASLAISPMTGGDQSQTVLTPQTQPTHPPPAPPSQQDVSAYQEQYLQHQQKAGGHVQQIQQYEEATKASLAAQPRTLHVKPRPWASTGKDATAAQVAWQDKKLQTVGTGTEADPFGSITMALDHANPGDMIIIHGGIYPPLAIINPPRDLSLVGAVDEEPMIRSVEANQTLLFVSGAVDLTVRNVLFVTDAPSCIGIETLHCSGLRLQQNQFQGLAAAYVSNTDKGKVAMESTNKISSKTTTATSGDHQGGDGGDGGEGPRHPGRLVHRWRAYRIHRAFSHVGYFFCLGWMGLCTGLIWLVAHDKWTTDTEVYEWVYATIISCAVDLVFGQTLKAITWFLIS